MISACILVESPIPTPVLLFYMKFVQIDSKPWQLFLVLEPIKQAQPSQDYVVFIHPLKQLVLDYNL